MKNAIINIDIKKIYPNPEQPRKTFENIEDLALTIKYNGLINPITVVKSDEDSYMIVSGERRYRACLLNQQNFIKCSIVDIDELHSFLNTPITFRKNFIHMRLRVLDKAYKDINERTSLKYEWEALKTKNKVTAIRFIFSQENRMVIQKETIKKLTDKFISEQARPGETWEEARERLSNR